MDAFRLGLVHSLISLVLFSLPTRQLVEILQGFLNPPSLGTLHVTIAFLAEGFLLHRGYC